MGFQRVRQDLVNLHFTYESIVQLTRLRVVGDTSQGRWPRGATSHPRSVAAAKRSYPMSKVRGGSPEELPHIRGHGRAAGRSYPTSKIRSRLWFARAAVKT